MFKDVEIETENIKLDQFLKWTNVVSSGGEAKLLISEGKVKVNGKIEFRRGTSLTKNDIVEIDKKGCFKVVPAEEWNGFESIKSKFEKF